MSSDVLIAYVPGVLIGLVIAVLVVLVLEIVNSRRVSKLTEPIYEYAQKRAEDEASRIVQAAKEEARALLAQAEGERTQLLSSGKEEREAAEGEYRKALQSIEAELTTRLQEDAKKSDDQGSKITHEYETRLEQYAASSQEKLTHSFDAIEQENKKRLNDMVERGSKAAEESSAMYERTLREQVDDRIVSLVARTVKVVLHKELSLEDHAELVRQALDEAKAQSAF